MKKDDVKIGGAYIAKVSDKLTEVRIDAEHPKGGWQATNLKTRKRVRIKSSRRLRGTAPGNKPADGDQHDYPGKLAVDAAKADAQPPRRARKRVGKSEMTATHKADQENARVREDREASPDNMTASERAMAESEQDANTADGGTEAADEANPNAGADSGEHKGRRGYGRRATLSCTDAAAQVLAEAVEPMNCRDLIEAMHEKALWTSEAPTPHSTLYSALLREIQKKGDESRFKKVERGKFTLAGPATAPGTKEG